MTKDFRPPQFEEITIVLKGMVQVTYRGGLLKVRASRPVVAHPGACVQYTTQKAEGVECVAACLLNSEGTPGRSMSISHS